MRGNRRRPVPCARVRLPRRQHRSFWLSALCARWRRSTSKPRDCSTGPRAPPDAVGPHPPPRKSAGWRQPRPPPPGHSWWAFASAAAAPSLTSASFFPADGVWHAPCSNHPHRVANPDHPPPSPPPLQRYRHGGCRCLCHSQTVHPRPTLVQGSCITHDRHCHGCYRTQLCLNERCCRISYPTRVNACCPGASGRAASANHAPRLSRRRHSLQLPLTAHHRRPRIVWRCHGHHHHLSAPNVLVSPTSTSPSFSSSNYCHASPCPRRRRAARGGRKAARPASLQGTGVRGSNGAMLRWRL